MIFPGHMQLAVTVAFGHCTTTLRNITPNRIGPKYNLIYTFIPKFLKTLRQASERA